MVTGKVGALTLNPDPLRLAEETVTAELPVFVRTIFWVVLVPTATLPKETLVGDAVSRDVAATVEVPESATGPTVFAASLLMARFPL